MRDVARLRLAGVLLDEKKYDEALKLLAAKPADAYAMLYADLRGDVCRAGQARGGARGVPAGARKERGEQPLPAADRAQARRAG